MATSVVGLDIGSTAVRGVELSAAGKTKIHLLRSYEIPLPVGAVIRGEIVEQAVVVAALKRLWSEGGFKSKRVVLGTGNQGVIVRELTVPKMSLTRIRESLPFQVQSMLQIPLADSLLDFYPTSESMGEQGPMVTGLLVAAEKKEILGNIRAVERAGLTPVEVDLIPFALNRLLVSRAQVLGSVALIDVGGNTTSIIIASNGVPWFVRIIPTGGEDLTQALMGGLEIDSQDAEELKRTLRIGAHAILEEDGSDRHTKCTCAKCLADAPAADAPVVEDPRAKEILQEVTGELLASLRSTVNYFNNTRPQDPVLQILLTGGGAQLSGIAEALGEITRVPVTQADPFATISLPRKREAKKLGQNVSMAVALGLALRSPA